MTLQEAIVILLAGEEDQQNFQLLKDAWDIIQAEYDGVIYRINKAKEDARLEQERRTQIGLKWIQDVQDDFEKTDVLPVLKMGI